MVKHALAVTAAAIGILACATAQASAAADISCTAKRVTVPQLSNSTYIHGTLCAPVQPVSNDVLVLVPGATYDGTYWDVSLGPDTYNFRLAMNRAGCTTFDLDRLGTGRSSVPPSALVTHQLQAAAVHDAIQTLTGGGGFSAAITVGHSLGSATIVTEAATYDDEAAVLLTGFSHTQNPNGFAGLATSLAPALLDPAFAGRDPGYVTTLPDHRDFLYGESDLTAAMRVYDESIKQSVSGIEIATALGTIVPIPTLPITPVLNLPPTGAIDVPVLSINGAQDKLFCNPAACASSTSFQHAEARYYENSPDFQAWVLPNAGHDINLAPNTQLYQQRVLEWLREVAP